MIYTIKHNHDVAQGTSFPIKIIAMVSSIEKIPASDQKKKSKYYIKLFIDGTSPDLILQFPSEKTAEKERAVIVEMMDQYWGK